MLVTVSNVWPPGTPQSLAASAIVNASTCGAPAIENLDSVLQPARVVNASAFGAPSIANLDRSIAPAAIVNASAFGEPVIANAAAPIDVSAIGTATASALTATITVPAGGVPAGALIAVGVCTEWGNGLSSVSDTAGNTYVRAKLSAAGLVPYVDVWYCKNCAALSPGDTIVTHQTTSSRQRASALFATNIDISAPLDQTPDATHATSSTPSITSAALSVSGELVIGWVGTTSSRVVTQDADFAAPPTEEASVGTYSIYGGHRIVANTDAQTYNPTLNNSQTWTALMTTFKPA